MQEIKNIQKALDDFHKSEWEDNRDSYSPIKPLYMLIKVDVNKDIVHNQCQAGKYATNHCKSLEYELVDWYYPDEEQYPYIAKWYTY